MKNVFDLNGNLLLSYVTTEEMWQVAFYLLSSGYKYENLIFE